MPSSLSNTSPNLGFLSASDTEPEINLGSQSDTDFEVVLVTRTTAGLVVSDSDSASLVSTPSDLSESSDDEHIFVQNITHSTPNTPRPPSFIPPRLDVTPRPPPAIPIYESGHDSEASDREDDSSAAGSLYDSDSDVDGSVVARARARTIAITHGRLEAPIALRPIASLGTVYGNGSTVTIRPALPVSPNTPRRSARAGMHTPAITTNTIAGIVESVPLSPPTPSDGGEIPYVPFTAAPTAVSIPAPVPATSSLTLTTAPPIPTATIVGKKKWAVMNTTRIKLGLQPLTHSYRKQLNLERKAKEPINAAPQPKPKSKSKKSRARAKAKAATNPLVAPPPTAGRSPVSSEDEAPRQRASIFSSVNDVSLRTDSPDEDIYDEAARKLDEHMTSPPEHPTAAYRFLLNCALLLEFRICTPEALPTSHGAAIAMVKANIHINVLDYVAKRKEGFNGLRPVMLASAKALRKNVKKRRMPAERVKSLGLHSLLIHQ